MNKKQMNYMTIVNGSAGDTVSTGIAGCDSVSICLLAHIDKIDFELPASVNGIQFNSSAIAIKENGNFCKAGTGSQSYLPVPAFTVQVQQSSVSQQFQLNFSLYKQIQSKISKSIYQP